MRKLITRICDYEPQRPARGAQTGFWARAVLLDVYDGLTTSEAARRAGVTRQAVYDLRDRDPFYAALLLASWHHGRTARADRERESQQRQQRRAAPKGKRRAA